MYLYREAPLRDDVKLNLPDDYICRVFEVTSDDSGHVKKYWVQILQPKKNLRQVLAVCQCNEGYFKAPLTILSLQDFFCKHVQALLGYLREKGQAA